MPNANSVSWPVPLTRLYPFYPGQFGVPGTDSDRGLRLDSNGKVLYVDPNHVDANDQRDGTNPESPLATVAEALTQCRAYMNDVIVVMPNSDWTYGNLSAGRPLPVRESVIVTVPGVRIVGVSSSGLGVNWYPAADNATCITVRAMDVTIEGFCFWNATLAGTTGVLAQWSGPTYYGETMTVRHCSFYGLAYGIQLDYAWYCNVIDCLFDSMTTAAIHNPSVLGDPEYLTIRDCLFLDNASAINLPDSDYCDIQHNKFQDNNLAITMLAGAKNIIHENVINEDPTGANNYINLTGGGNNIVSGNWLGCTIAQYDVACSDATSGQWVNNHCTNGDTTAPPL
jgi:hypothetical protein